MKEVLRRMALVFGFAWTAGAVLGGFVVLTTLNDPGIHWMFIVWMVMTLTAPVLFGLIHTTCGPWYRDDAP